MQKKKISNKKAGLILVAVVALFSWASSFSVKNVDGEHGGHFRFPASQIFSQPRSASTEIEKKWAKKLAQTQKRQLASVGRNPNTVESLRFGLLEGKYSFEMDGEKIHALSFVDNPASESSPTYVKDRADFLVKYGSLFGYTGLPERLSIDVDGRHIVETYKLKTAKGVEAKVKVTLDQGERLLGVNPEKSADLKIF